MATIAASQSISYVDIRGTRYAPLENKKLKTVGEFLVDFPQTLNGGFRLLQLMERVCKVVMLVLREMGDKLAVFFEDLAGKLGLAWAVLTLPRLPKVTQDAQKAIVDWSKPPQGPIVDPLRDKLQKVHDIADATAAWGYAAALVSNNPTVKTAADVPNLVGDVTDLSMAAQDWNKAKEYLKYVDPTKTGGVHERFQNTMKYALIKLIKAVCSVASGVLGLMVLVFGGPVLPAAALLGLSLTSTIAAISAQAFKETVSTYELVDFYKVRNPEVLVAGAPAA